MSGYDICALPAIVGGAHSFLYQEVSDMAARSTSKPDTDTTDDDAPTAAPAGNAGGESSTPEPASAGSPDPTRIVIEQAPPEPAVFYGEDALVPGAGNATDPNRPHVKADYHPFEW